MDTAWKRPGEGKGLLVCRACLVGLACLVAPARANLLINDLLNTYQLYGKEWIRLDGDAETSQDGGIGSDLEVNFSNHNVKVNGSVTSGGNLIARENVDIADNLNVRGDATFLNTGSSVLGWTNIGGRLLLTGGDPENNLFADSMHIFTAPITLPGWAKNTFVGVDKFGSINNANKAPGMTFGSNRAFPIPNMILPDTVVDFDASKNCATPPGVVFNMSMCGLGGAAADSILPPGRYGDWVIASGNRFYLTTGTYHFRSLNLLSDGTRMIFNQPGEGVTRVLVHGNFTVGGGITLVAPARYTDPAFNAGTVLIHVNGTASLGDDNSVWATVVSPNATVLVRTGLRLYGQIFGRRISVQNGFKGGVGMGRFIPIRNKPNFKFSLIHFKYKG